MIYNSMFSFNLNQLVVLIEFLIINAICSRLSTRFQCTRTSISSKAKAAVCDVLDSGRLFRYQGATCVSNAECGFAKYVGASFALGANSGGCGLFLALKSAGPLCLAQSRTLGIVQC